MENSPLTRWAASLGVAAAALLPAAFAAPLQVEIPAAKGDKRSVALAGHEFVPKRDAEAKGRAPAVLMLHGCGGAFGRDGELNARHRMWGEYLASLGYVAVMLDSFGPRGLREICTQKTGERSIRERDRVADAMSALEWLRARDDIDPDRVALLGWSHGGGTVLGAVTQLDAKAPRAAAAVSFYPGCSTRAKGDRFHARVPLLLLIGEADDWTPAAPCKALAEAAAQRGEPMAIVTYPGAYHDFDHPGLRGKRVRHEVPNGVNPGKGVTTAPDPVAREDAKRRVRDFLRQHLEAKDTPRG